MDTMQTPTYWYLFSLWPKIREMDDTKPKEMLASTPTHQPKRTHISTHTHKHIHILQNIEFELINFMRSNTHSSIVRSQNSQNINDNNNDDDENDDSGNDDDDFIAPRKNRTNRKTVILIRIACMQLLFFVRYLSILNANFFFFSPFVRSLFFFSTCI